MIRKTISLYNRSPLQPIQLRPIGALIHAHFCTSHQLGGVRRAHRRFPSYHEPHEKNGRAAPFAPFVFQTSSPSRRCARRTLPFSRLSRHFAPFVFQTSSPTIRAFVAPFGDGSHHPDGARGPLSRLSRPFAPFEFHSSHQRVELIELPRHQPGVGLRHLGGLEHVAVALFGAPGVDLDGEGERGQRAGVHPLGGG